MKYIKLTKNKRVIVDDEDYPYLNRLKWTACGKDGRFYAVLGKKVEGSRKVAMFYLYEFLIKLDDYNCVNFKNKNPLDCRKSNLIAISEGFKIHRGKKYNRMGIKPSKYRGLSWHKAANSWQVRIMRKQINYPLGFFKEDKEKEAAIAYNKKAKELYGEFAYQNIIKKR